MSTSGLFATPIPTPSGIPMADGSGVIDSEWLLPNASGYLHNDGAGILAWSIPAAGADPTALVGLSAVNGTALTFLRSDGAPALDQSIAPTWSALHTFQVAPLSDINDGNISTVVQALKLRHNTGGGAASNLGSALDFYADSTTVADRQQARILAQWTTASDATRKARLIFQTINNGSLVSALTLASTGAASFVSSISATTGTFSGGISGTQFTASNATGLLIGDASASGFNLAFNCADTLTATRTLSFLVNDSGRSVTFTGNPTLDDWFNQSVKTTAKPTFAGFALTAPGVLQNYTVATLPSAVTWQYGLAFVTDATLTAITGLGLVPTGGGTNIVPVYSDGTNWIML